MVPSDRVVIAQRLLLDVHLLLHLLCRVRLLIIYHTDVGEDRDRRGPLEVRFPDLIRFRRSQSCGKTILFFLLNCLCSVLNEIT